MVNYNILKKYKHISKEIEENCTKEYSIYTQIKFDGKVFSYPFLNFVLEMIEDEKEERKEELKGNLLLACCYQYSFFPNKERQKENNIYFLLNKNARLDFNCENINCLSILMQAKFHKNNTKFVYSILEIYGIENTDSLELVYWCLFSENWKMLFMINNILLGFDSNYIQKIATMFFKNKAKEMLNSFGSYLLNASKDYF